MDLDQVEEEPLGDVKLILDVLKDAETPLYDGCQLSQFSVAARMANIISEHNIPLQAIDKIAAVMKHTCPEGDKIMETVNEAKLLVSACTLLHHKIDVCPNGCMLFWKEAAHLQNCDLCKESRYEKNSKGKPIAKRVLTYFPIAPRLQRLYATNSTAVQMRWHSENQRTDGSMVHPCDGQAWKAFDAMYPEFAAEPRNIRLGLYADGFYPFGRSGKSYCCWPVIIAPYNLPPWLCMTNPFMFMSLIIPGPRSPKEKLDVYLQPLMEELKLLWDGAVTYDISRKQNFKMHAAVIWTVSEFSAYGMLSGWRTEGKLACPYCMENTKSFTLECGHKETWFDCHRQFLPHDHIFRKNTSDFTKNKVENSPPPPRLSGDQIWDRVSSFPKTADCRDMSRMHGLHNWTKQSIFWELPYWRKLLIRHSLDVMDIEKNFFDQLIHSVMDDRGKSLDNENARKGQLKSCKRRRLQLEGTSVEDGNVRETTQAPPYLLNEEKRKALCKWIQELTFPDGYPSNLSRYVNLQKGKLLGMKSHDCHVFMERLLPVALRELLPVNVWSVITELSQFFRDISRAILQTDDMDRLERNIPEILCKLERIFPPAFFGATEHMSIHLPYEAKVGGPVQYRSTYPFQRFLHYLKGKLGTKARVESSLCAVYLAEETSNFCNHYLKRHLDQKAKNVVCNVDKALQETRPQKIPNFFYYNPKDATVKQRFLELRDFNTAHGYVLANCELLKEYERLFEQAVIAKHPDYRASDVWSKFGDQFPKWFKEHILSLKISPDNILWTLAVGPRRDARKYNRYSINGYNFHTYAYGKNKSTMNYGVCVKDLGVERYGILQEVIELTYVGDTCYKTTLFKCDWFETGNSINVHPLYKLVEVNFTKKQSKYEPFVLPQRVEQVYFAPYPSIKNDREEWRAVFKIKARSRAYASVNQIAFQEGLNRDPPLLSGPTEDHEEDLGKSDEEDRDEHGKETAILEQESEDNADFLSEMDDDFMSETDKDNNDAGQGETDSSETDYDNNDDDQSDCDSCSNNEEQ